MNRPPKSKEAWPWIRFYLEVHLPKHRRFSPHTISSYRTAFRQFRNFLAQRSSDGCESLSLTDFDPRLFLDFLEWLERDRGRRIAISTRNQRLAALRSFFAFLELYCDQVEPSLWQRLRKLPFKRAPKGRVDYLESHEMSHLFASVPRDGPDGHRDFTLLALLYNTGCRASEAASVQRSDLMLAEPPSVRLLGKGDKVRVCPLWAIMATHLEKYWKDHRRRPRPGHENFVFINQRGGHLTRFGVARIVSKHLRRARETRDTLAGKRLSTHSIRHSTAIGLLQSGAEINAVRTWLGHATMGSTSHYLDLNLETQRELLNRFTAPPILTERASEPLARTDDAEATELRTWLKKL